MKPGEYALEGKIIDTVSMPPYCGIFAFATAVKMEIISYSDTSYKHRNIVVVYGCPESYGKEYFQIGKVHTVVLLDHNPANFGWMIYDEEKLKQNSLAYYPFVDRELER